MKRHLGVIFLLIRENAVLFEQKRDGQWLLPGGHILDGKSPLAAVRREAMEELGITVQFVGGEQLFDDQPNSRCLSSPFAAFEHIVERDSVLSELHFNEVFAYVVTSVNDPQAMEGQNIRWIGMKNNQNSPVPYAAAKIAGRGFTYYQETFVVPKRANRTS